MRRELQAAARKGLTLPEIIGERCVHSLMEKASCRACVDACPRDAWTINDDMLGINGVRCDGCDLCAPVCPQGAIEGRFSASLKLTEQGGAAFAACEHAGVRSSREGLMPCLHGIGMSDLLQLRRDGTGFLITSRGDCETCERSGATRLDRRIDETNQLLESRGSAPLVHRCLSADAWDKAFRRICDLAASRTIDRRAFFRSAIKLPKERVETAIADAIGSFIPPGMLLPEGDATDPLYPCVPRIDPRLCTGCDACAQLCPHQAIEVQFEEQHAPLYSIHAERCSGCGICTDVCESDAVVVVTRGRQGETRIPLRERRCPACGADFHVPAVGAGAAGSLCWVCRRSNHHRNLYQVLD